MAFPKFPYTDFHRLNADWILETVKAASAAVAESLEAVRTALSDAVLYISQTKTAQEQRTACGNIGAVSYHTQSASPADRTVARANLQAVGYEAQTLTEAEKTQARTNIGAISSGDIPPAANAVLYTEQSLTELQKAQARNNIEAASSSQYNTLNGRVHSLEDSAVKYTSQNLTNEQKAQARTNIGAISSGDIPPAPSAVLYTTQQLSDSQQAQARNNIGAISESALPDDYTLTVSENEQGTGYGVTGSLSEASRAGGRVFIVLAQSGRTREALADLVDSGGAVISASAYFSEFFAVDSTIPNTITQVVITANGATVTDIQQRQVPQPAPLGADMGKVLTASRNGAGWQEPGPVRNTVSGATPTITPVNNNIYICGTVTDLTIDTFPTTGMWSIVFVSGATATSTDFPVTINGLDDFVPETNTRYEINVLDGWAVVGSWEVTA